MAGELDLWARTCALPLWWEVGADLARGGFHDAISQDGTPVVGPRRLRVQARQVYTYATAYTLGWTGSAAKAVEHGLTQLFGRHLRSDGRFRSLVAEDGAVIDDTPALYDQAFVLLALAAACRR